MGCYIDYLCMLYSVMVASYPLASASPTCHCGECTPVSIKFDIIESVDSICRDSVDTQYMPIQTNLSKSPKQLTYKPL